MLHLESQKRIKQDCNYRQMKSVGHMLVQINKNNCKIDYMLITYRNRDRFIVHPSELATANSSITAMI